MHEAENGTKKGGTISRFNLNTQIQRCNPDGSTQKITRKQTIVNNSYKTMMTSSKISHQTTNINSNTSLPSFDELGSTQDTTVTAPEKSSQVDL